MGDFDSLLEEAEKGIHLAAEDEHRVRFLVAKASALDEKGKYGDALNAYAEALTLDPKCAVATLNRGVTLLKMGQSDAALESFDQALSLDPGLSLAHVNRAGVLASAGDYASAIDELTEALRSLPPGPVRALALLSRGTSLAGLGKNRDALADLDDAFLEYRDPLAKSRCLFHKAIAHKDLADQTSAMAAIDAAIELHNEAPAFHLLRAELLLRDEELETASSSVARALSLNPSAGMAAQAHDFLARIQTEGGNLPEALTENDKAIALDPENASLHHNRGLTLLQQGRLRDATVSFTDALHRDQGNAGAWNNRGIARGAQGDYTGAMADYEKAVEVAVDPHDTGSSLRHLAQCHLLIGEAAEAECCLERARASDPDSPFNLVIEGLILLYRGEFDNSLSLRADAAGEEDAPDIQIYMSLPIILLGEIEKGVEIAERHWQELGALVTRNEFMNHARALCTMFRTQKALDALLEVEAKT